MFFEIILFILGFAFIILSFFIGNTEKEQTEVKSASFTFPEEDLAAAEQRISDEIGLASQNAITDTENKLSTMSNETIMFVDDFARQTMERIQHNHDEVVFMYNMLQTKEDELKLTERNIVFENERLSQQKAELENMLVPKLSEESGIEMARRKSSADKADKEEKKRSNRSESAAPIIEAPIVDSSEFADEEEENKTQKILELYHQKKSVLDISKQLGLGQGEVKLVIDLYGRS